MTRIAIDMDRVTREALASRRWRLEYDSNGAPFVWAGQAASEAEADARARRELAVDQPTFRSADARLVECVERHHG